MALHQVSETYKVNILGQEITYTNRFIKHTEGTSYGFKPSPHMIGSSSRLFKYEYEHYMLPPTLFISPVDGQKYIVPTWQKVHSETTLNDIEWIKPEIKKVNQLEDSKPSSTEYKFESKSEPGNFYVVRVTGDKVKCNCAGQYRAKDRQCKHMKEVRQKLGL
jgi:hypothetical protein